MREHNIRAQTCLLVQTVAGPAARMALVRMHNVSHCALILHRGTDEVSGFGLSCIITNHASRLVCRNDPDLKWPPQSMYYA